MFNTLINTVKLGYRATEKALESKDKGSNIFSSMIAGVLVIVLYFSLNGAIVTAANSANASINANASGAQSAATAYGLVGVFLALGGLVMIARVTMGE